MEKDHGVTDSERRWLFSTSHLFMVRYERERFESARQADRHETGCFITNQLVSARHIALAVPRFM